MNDTPTRLLEATQRCIARHGLSGTTSRDITAEAGANLAAITYHFGSKDQLVAEALLDSLRRWLAPTIAVLDGDGDPAARTLVAVRTLTDTFADHRDEAPAYLQAIIEAPRIRPLHDGLVALWSDLRHLLIRDMEAMRAAGELAAWVDPHAMSALLVAVANGVIAQVTVDPDGPGLEAMAAQFAALLLTARGS